MKKLMLALFAFIAQMSITAVAMAADGASEASNLIPIGAGLTMAIAALGGTLAQGKAASAALEGIARNPGAAPKVQTPMILALALIESLVLFSFVIAFLLTNKV